MKMELEKNLRQIVQVVYCNSGKNKVSKFIELIKPFCMSKELKEIVKVIENEKKLIDKRFEENLYRYYEEYYEGKQ